MRIVSLLPSATEIVFALGLGDDLVGVTHECDWPAPARDKRIVTRSVIPDDASPAEVDRLVREGTEDGGSIYRLDEDAFRELDPDLVITQDLCAVCALPSGHVEDALEHLGCRATVVSLDPTTVDEVLESILSVGEATGTGQRASEVVAELRERLGAVQAAVAGAARPATLALEWSDPPFNAGHWVPGMIEAAGGLPVLAEPGTPSTRITWEQVADARPEVMVFMPCGYDLIDATQEGRGLLDRPALAAVERVYAVDATAYFSRPGPRLVEGVEILAALVHPECVDGPPPETAHRLR